MPKHGVARDQAWRLAPSPGPGSWRAVLGDDAATRAVWPHAFELTLTASAVGDRLDAVLAVRNPGDTPFTFTAALHGNLALGGPGATVHGLGGHRAEDNEDGLTRPWVTCRPAVRPGSSASSPRSSRP